LLFEQWTEAAGFPDDPRPRVLLFPDTFTNWYEPAIGMAAAGILRHLGCRVVTVLGEGFRKDLSFPTEQPVGMRCCGRPFISNGLLDKAVENARYNVENLYPWAATGKPILACEPSCILTIKDDYPALVGGEMRHKAEVVAAACRTFEEYVDESLASCKTEFIPFHPERNEFRSTGMPPARRILVQAHCHQRSLVGVEPLLKLVRRIPGAEVIDADAGCCGMAGSFGYEKEHYEVSRLIGEQRLFPAIRARDGAEIAVTGFSCAEQIGHYTDTSARHALELVADRLPANPPPSGDVGKR
jgi:Fe-S oxidoreductase